MNKNPFGISVGMNTYRLLPEYARAGFEVVEICPSSRSRCAAPLRWPRSTR